MTLQERFFLSKFLGERVAGLEEDLFSGLSASIRQTAQGIRVSDMGIVENGFRVFEIRSQDGLDLGYFNLLFFEGPLDFYYQVYLDIGEEFRGNGLGGMAVEFFKKFLEEKNAGGILMNIIPPENPERNLYRNRGWQPINLFLPGFKNDDEYMIYIPEKLWDRLSTGNLRWIVGELERRRKEIGILENEFNVKRTLEEFRHVYAALLKRFKKQMGENQTNDIMEYLFTRWAFKFLAFKRDISKLTGFTGGDSTEAVKIDLFVSALMIRPFLDLPRESAQVEGEEEILAGLPNDFWQGPARFIEKLPDYPRLPYIKWLQGRKRDPGAKISIRDLFEIGLDPTRLKCANIGGLDYVIERKQSDHRKEFRKRREILEALARRAIKESGMRLKFNPPLCWIYDKGNTYIFRRRLPAVHWNEAMRMISGEFLGSVRNCFRGALRQAYDFLEDSLGWKIETIKDYFTPFLAVNPEMRYPKIIIEPARSYPEMIWMA